MKFKFLIIAIVIMLVSVSFGGASNISQPRISGKVGKHVTHLGVGTWFLEKNSVRVFYKIFSPIQKSLARHALDIIYNQYEICSKILNLSIEELYPCSMVFCKSRLDLYILRCKWYAYVDGILCWPIIREKSMQFKDPLNEWMLYYLLPHEIVDTSLRRGIDSVYGGWFIEGTSEYASLMCANASNQLNATYFINRVIKASDCFSEQEERIVDLSNRSSFAGFGAPGSEDEYIFYVGSLVYIYDLVKKYGGEFISDVVANNCTSYEDIRLSIENSTGYNVNDSIKNISVGWIKQQYISFLEEFNVNITGY